MRLRGEALIPPLIRQDWYPKRETRPLPAEDGSGKDTARRRPARILTRNSAGTSSPQNCVKIRLLLKPHSHGSLSGLTPSTHPVLSEPSSYSALTDLPSVFCWVFISSACQPRFAFALRETGPLSQATCGPLNSSQTAHPQQTSSQRHPPHFPPGAQATLHG